VAGVFLERRQELAGRSQGCGLRPPEFEHGDDQGRQAGQVGEYRADEADSGSHSVYLSQPKAVASLIDLAGG